MCGRFTLYADPDFLEDYFDLENGGSLDWEPRYNIAPSQDIVTIVQGREGFRGGLMKWGLVPSWAEDVSIGYKMMNARSETIHKKPSFRHLVNKRHCLIVTNGFYEWKKENGNKQPYYIHYTDGDLVVMAGVWDRWNSPSGAETITCTILTTEANTFMQDLHHRMPVILPRKKWRNWLNPKGAEYEDLKLEFFEPISSDLLQAHAVSTYVNNARNESPTCVDAI